MAKRNTTDKVAKIICHATKKVIEASTGKEISFAPTIQRIPSINLKPDLGCFVQFNGDYSGLFIMNLSGEAAVEIYRNAMTFMGLPEDDLSNDYTSDDVVNYIGEMINQVIGNVRQMIEQEYGLTADNNQPKAITISTAINLSIATMISKAQSRRISFKTTNYKPFHIEINLEQTEFIRLFPKEEAQPNDVQGDIDAMLTNGTDPEQGGKAEKKEEEEVDIDALMAEFG
jgi:hypothetical protein